VIFSAFMCVFLGALLFFLHQLLGLRKKGGYVFFGLFEVFFFDVLGGDDDDGAGGGEDGREKDGES
jgi:hypothetical protein